MDEMLHVLEPFLTDRSASVFVITDNVARDRRCFVTVECSFTVLIPMTHAPETGSES